MQLQSATVIMNQSIQNSYLSKKNKFLKRKEPNIPGLYMIRKVLCIYFEAAIALHPRLLFMSSY